MNKEFNRILIVRTDRIGDVILTTPALAALRSRFPKAWIALLVSPLTAELISKNPHVNEVLIDDRVGVHAGTRGFWRLVGEIKKKQFDLAVIFHTKRRTNLLCFLAGIPQRLGYKNDKYGFLLNRPVLDERPTGKKHETQYCLDLLATLGVAFSEQKLHISIHDEAEQWAEHYFTQQGFTKDNAPIAVHFGASDPSKCWSFDHVLVLLVHLIAGYHNPVVLIGTKDITARASHFAQRFDGRVFDLTGQTSLSQLASILRRCKMLISNDSGPVHMAAAAGIPVVSIFTRNQPGINPERWRPLEARSRVVSVEFDPAPSFEKAGSASPEYLQKIQPKAVLEAVDAIYKLC